jgi:cell division protein FtsL
MLRASDAVAIALTLVCAFALYTINYDTRRLEQRVQARERAAATAAAQVAVLKAERAFLARPDRIEPLAYALGMQPVSERQYVRLEDLPLRDEQPNEEPSMLAPAQGPSPAASD